MEMFESGLEACCKSKAMWFFCSFYKMCKNLYFCRFPSYFPKNRTQHATATSNAFLSNFPEDICSRKIYRCVELLSIIIICFRLSLLCKSYM